MSSLRPRRECSRAGLTLVEVMLAITILGVGLVALIASASRCLAVIRQARNYESARRLLVRVDYEEPIQLKDEIKAESESGSFVGGPAGWRWSREFTVVGEEEDGLFEVVTRVHWGDQSDSVSEDATTYLYVPKNAEGKRTLKPRT